jgi:DNA mismatch repair protein MutH
VVDVPDGEHQTVRTKGFVGAHVERYFGVAANTDAGPDLLHLGVELKAVPMRKLKQRSAYSAKERTFITQIHYPSIVGRGFENSALDTKSRRTLYVFYEWQRDRPTAETHVLTTYLHDRDEAALDMLRRAHEHVKSEVLAGRAHLLSEGDTPGVGAATKDAGGRWVEQPFGPEPARRRGFAWKAAYTSELFRSIDTGPAPVRGGLEALLLDARHRTARASGHTIADLRDELLPGRSDRWKSLTGAVARRVLGSPSSSTEPAAYRRYGLLVRAVRLDAEGRPWEATSFPAVDFRDVAEEEWESSPLVEQLRSILLVVFLDPRKVVTDAVLDRVVHWRPSDEDIATMRDEYEMLRSFIARSRPDLAPTEAQTRIIHLRPHGSDGTDKVPLPNGTLHRRSSFWLNKRYLQRILADT